MYEKKKINKNVKKKTQQFHFQFMILKYIISCNINGFNSKPFIVEILQHHIKQINIFQM